MEERKCLSGLNWYGVTSISWLRERVAHFRCGREKARVPGLTFSSVSSVKTKCCPGPVRTSTWGHDCLSKSLGLTMALLVMVRVSLGHLDTFILRVAILMSGESLVEVNQAI